MRPRSVAVVCPLPLNWNRVCNGHSSRLSGANLVKGKVARRYAFTMLGVGDVIVNDLGFPVVGLGRLLAL
jgi:hypothetical protein